ncbi:hypothetical protein SMALB_2236 [Streptomyces malaysiensis]|uniref:Uncharacterized protein n=2 Tax=Streptomyces malaysiensis TaxID=92644 RepID=A0A7X5X0C3_STRMQ|nr:hypothetical protein [Streptomyces malaysiensis]
MNKKNDVHFPLIHNGMDYLVTVGEALRAVDQARGMKYAVLSLYAATELLLKWPLMQQDWRLVALPHPNETELCGEQEFRGGHCPSIGLGQARQRLRDELDIKVPGPAKKAIDHLIQHRNRLQHFEMTAQVEMVKARTEKVLSFLLDFVHDHLRRFLDPSQTEHVDEQLAVVRDVLHEMETFVATRMQLLQSRLQGAGPVVECPECGQGAAVVDAYETTTRCLFCHSSWDSEAAARVYADPWGIASYEAGKQGGDDPVLNCPECDLRTFVRDVKLVGAVSPVDFCFNCAEQFATMGLCHNGCGTPAREDFCPECHGILFSRFD